MAGQLLMSLSILIVLHEFGHFLPARLFNTRVEKFYLFFDPWFSLFKFKRGETEYGIGWLPLGGYVKISGMIDESMDREQMALPPQPWEFRSKPAWQRLIIMLGGVTVNFILGGLIFGMTLFVWGETYLPAQNAKYGIYADSMANQIGLQTGDMVLSIDQKPLRTLNDVQRIIFLEEPKTIQVQRNGQNTDVQVPDALTGKLANYKGDFILARAPFIASSFVDKSPAEKAGMKKDDQIISLNGKPTPYFDAFALSMKEFKNKEVAVGVLRGTDTVNLAIQLGEDAKIGVYNYGMDHFFDLETKEYSALACMPAGFNRAYNFLGDYMNSLGQIFNGKVAASESLGGFGAIGGMFGDVWIWERFWKMTAILSLILAFMNLLPIPALDGGHVMFLLYEVVTGRGPNEKFMEYATIIGFVLVFGLVLYANGMDIYRAFFQ